MLGADTAGYAVERLDAAPDDHWMHRFLGPGLVDCLAPSCVADRCFARLTPLRRRAGETVVREGEPADMFYVLANGSRRGARDVDRIACA